MRSPFCREPAPLVTRWRRRTVAKGDSMTFPVRRCSQCSAGKSKKASSRSSEIGHPSCVFARRPSLGRYVKSHRGPAAGRLLPLIPASGRAALKPPGQAPETKPPRNREVPGV